MIQQTPKPLKWFPLLLFIVPLVELALIVKVGSYIGVGGSISLVLLTAFIGVTLIRRQGITIVRDMQMRMAAGEIPAQQLLDGVAVAVGGILLLTPGYLTDAVGISCLLPPLRRRVFARLIKNINFSAHTFASQATGNASVHRSPAGFDGEAAHKGAASDGGAGYSEPHRPIVIEGQFKREDASEKK